MAMQIELFLEDEIKVWEKKHGKIPEKELYS